MSISTPVYTCDGCGKVDMNKTIDRSGWYLNLTSGSKTRIKQDERSAQYVLSYDEPEPDPIPSTLHFCDVKCLGKWIVGQSKTNK